MKRFLPIIALLISLSSTRFAIAETTEQIMAQTRMVQKSIDANLRNYAEITIDLPGYAVNGGEMTAYLDGQNAVHKIVGLYLGDYSRATEEFYFVEGSLVCVRRTETYYGKSLSGKAYITNGDGHFSGSTYNFFSFDKGKLILWDRGFTLGASPSSTRGKQREAKLLNTARYFLKKINALLD